MARIQEDICIIEAQNIMIGDTVLITGFYAAKVLDVKHGPSRVWLKLDGEVEDFICGNLRLVQIIPAPPLPEAS